MHYQRLSTVVLLGAFTITAPQWLRADEPSAAESKEHHWDAAKMQKKLDLTDDQVTKLNAAREAEKDARKPLWEKQKDLMKKLEGQVKDKASDSDIQATLADMRSNRKAIADQMEQFQNQKDGILTPTQQAKMLIARMKHGRGEWHKKAAEK